MEFFTYIIYSSKCDKYYVGHTENLERRIYEHNNSKGGKFSTSCLPWQIVYFETFANRTNAVKREREIKSKKSRKYILDLIKRSS